MNARPWRGAGAPRRNRGSAAQRHLRTARSREAGPGGSSGGCLWHLAQWVWGLDAPMVAGGSPPWHDGSGASTGQEGSDPVVFPPQSRTETTGTGDYPPEGVWCAGSITGQANPSQTSEHQRHAALSCVPPLPSRPPGSCPTSTCPALAAQRGDVPSVFPPALLPLPAVAVAPLNPRGRGAGSAGLCWRLRPGTGEQRNNVPLLWTGGPGHCRDITGTPGPGERG